MPSSLLRVVATPGNTRLNARVSSEAESSLRSRKAKTDSRET